MVGIAVRAARSTFFRRVLFSAGTFVPAVAGSGWIGGTDALFRLAVLVDSRGAAFFWWGLPAGIVVAGLLYGFTTDAFWQAKKGWLRPMMWCSADCLCLVHLFRHARVLTWFLVPYALLICLMLFFAGSVYGLPAGQPGFLVGGRGACPEQCACGVYDNPCADAVLTVFRMEIVRYATRYSGFRTVARQAEIYPLRICQIYMRRTCRNRSSRGIR